MSFIDSHNLIELKNTLSLMVQQHRITEEEMIAILRKAGLAALPHSDGWIDEQGNRYYEAD